MAEKQGNWKSTLIGILILLVGFFGGLGVRDVLERLTCNTNKIAASEQRITILETTVAIQIPAIARSIEEINRKLEQKP